MAKVKIRKPAKPGRPPKPKTPKKGGKYARLALRPEDVALAKRLAQAATAKEGKYVSMVTLFHRFVTREAEAQNIIL
jgi:hypothetical protein